MGSLVSRTSLVLMQKGTVIQVQPWLNQQQLNVLKEKNMAQSEPNTFTGFRSWFQKISKKSRTQHLQDVHHSHKEKNHKTHIGDFTDHKDPDHKACIGSFNDRKGQTTGSELGDDWTSNSEFVKEDATFTVSMPNLPAPIKHKPTKKSIFYLIKKEGDRYRIETGSCPNTQQWYANVLNVVPASEDKESLKKSTSMPVLQGFNHSLSDNFSNDPSYPDTCSSEESWYTPAGNINIHASTNARNSPNETDVFFVVRERHGCFLVAAVECSNVYRWFARKFHRLPDASSSADTLYQVPSIKDEIWEN